LIFRTMIRNKAVESVLTMLEKYIRSTRLTYRVCLVPKSYLLVRPHLESIVASLVLMLLILLRQDLVPVLELEGRLSSYYAAVFAWASLQGAFLFSVYAFFLSRSEPFVEAISRTHSFRKLRDYILRATWLTLGLSLISLPLLVASPPITEKQTSWLSFGVFAGVTSLFSYTFMCFVKVIRVFRVLDKTQG
jgi:hypothetical protein